MFSKLEWKMRTYFLRRFTFNPFWIVSVGWAFVLLAPHLPGLPRPAIGGLPWRQELLTAILVSLTLGLLIKRAARVTNQVKGFQFTVSRTELWVIGSLGLFVAWMWLSTLWAAHSEAAVQQSFQWTAYLIFTALMMRAVAYPRLVRGCLISLGLVVLILGASCVIESWFGAVATDGNLRANAKPIFRSSGGFGEIMAIAAPLFGAFALYLRRLRPALLCGAIAVLAWLGVMQALQRAPLIGGIVGLLIVFSGACFKSNYQTRNLLRAGLLLAALIAVTALQTVPSPLTNQDPATISRLQQGIAQGDRNTQVRLMLWSVTWEMFRAHPLYGVGANNYESNYPKARAEFSARYPDSDLVLIDEEKRTVYAHNEYLQMLAELGSIGFALFLIFSAVLIKTFWQAVAGRSRIALPALGAGGGMLAFAISSGASASSFRYFGGSLLFFFAAAIVTRSAASKTLFERGTRTSTAAYQPQHFVQFSPVATRTVAAGGCVLAGLMLLSTGRQAAGAIISGLAVESDSAVKTDYLYHLALLFEPANATTHFSYGAWLQANKRQAEAVPHLRYAADNGFNSSLCYVELAKAEAATSDFDAAENTFALAAKVYPRSISMRVLHADALRQTNRLAEAENELQTALKIDERAARGWWQLKQKGLTKADSLARADNNIARPSELLPQECVLGILSEEDLRPRLLQAQNN